MVIDNYQSNRYAARPPIFEHPKQGFFYFFLEIKSYPGLGELLIEKNFVGKTPIGTPRIQSFAASGVTFDSVEFLKSKSVKKFLKI